MKIVSFIPLALLVICAQVQKSEQTNSVDSNHSSNRSVEVLQGSISASYLITCGGIGDVKMSDSMDDLERKFGKTNLVPDSLFAEGDFVGMGTKLWKNTEKEISIYWKGDKAPYKTIRVLEISNPKSPYHFANGVGVGTTMEKLVKLNGGVAIHFSGFEVDEYLAGRFISFNGGQLSRELPCFGGKFDYQGDDSMGVVGETIFKSDDPLVQKIKCKLTRVSVCRHKH